MKKKLYFLFVFLILITSLVIWRKPLSLSTTRIAFKYLSEKSLGEPIDFEALKFEKGRVILTAPKLGDERRVSKDGGLYLEAEKAIISYDLDWFHKTLELNIDLKRPDIKVVKTKDAYKAIKNLFSSKVAYIDIKTYFKVDKGTLSLIEDSKVQDLNFNFETKEVAQSQVIAHLNLSKEDSHLDGFFHKKEEGLDFKLDFEEVEVGSILSMSDYVLDLIGKPTLPLEDAKGLLHGSVSVLLQPGHLPMAQVKADVSQFQFKSPDRYLSAQIPKLFLSLETLNKVSSQESLTLESLIQNSFGSLYIPTGSNLSHQLNETLIWEAKDLKGRLIFSKDQPSKFNFDGNLKVEGQESQVALIGLGHLTSPRGEAQVVIQNVGDEESTIKLSLNPSDQGRFKLSLGVKNFRESEMILFKRLLDPLYPELKTIDLKEGQIDAQMRCLIEQREITEFTVDRFALKNVSLGPIFYFQSIQNLNAMGNLTLNLEGEKPLSTCSGDIEFDVETLEVPEHLIEGVEGRCRFVEGKLEYSKMGAFSSGIEALLEWKLSRQGEPLFLELKGLGEDFFPYVPSNFVDYYRSELAHENMYIKLKGIYLKDRANLSASCHVNQKHLLNFGFSLVKESKPKIDSRELELFFKSFISPLKIVPTLGAVHYPKSSLFKLKEGWFLAKKVPVEKYLSPLLFGNTSIIFSGNCDLKGSFDQSTLFFEYSNYHFHLDHADVSLEIQDYTSKGKHYFSFNKGTHFGEVPVKQGTCQVNGVDLIFEDLLGDLHITSSCLYAPRLKTLSNQISFEGDLKINFLGNGNLNLQLYHPELQGQFSDLKKILKAFGDSIIDDLPLEGHLKINPRGAYFQLMKEEGCSHTLQVGGELTHAQALLGDAFPLTNLSSSFYYDSKEGTFEIEALKGKWLLSSQNHFDIQSNHLKLDFKSKEPSLFDIRIKDAYLDRARLMGQLHFNTQQDSTALKIVLDSDKNHIGNIGLNHMNLTLQKELKPGYLHLDFKTDLKTFNEDVALLNALIPHSALTSLTSLKSVPLSGEISGQWIFNRSDEKHQFFAWGDRVRVGQDHASPLQLKGKYQKGITYLDELRYHHFKVSLKLEEKPLSYFIHDFRVQGNDAFYMDLSGSYCKIFKSFQSHIHKLYCDIGRVKKLVPYLEDTFLKECFGKVNFRGQLEGGNFKGDWKYLLDLKGKSKGLKVSEFQFEESPMQFKIRSVPGGFQLASFQGAFQSIFNAPLPLRFKATNLDFQKDLKLCKAQNFQFKVPASSLETVEGLLNEKLGVDIPNGLLNVKKEGWVEGAIAYNPQDSQYAFNFGLEDDHYLFKDKSYALEDLTVQYGALGLSIGAKVHYNHMPYWVNFKKDAFVKDLVSYTLYEQNPLSTKPNLNPHVTLKCLVQNEGPTLFKTIQGNMGGVKIDFVHKPEKEEGEEQVFMGQVQVDGCKLLKRLPKKFGEVLQKVGIGSGYFLSGQLSLNPKHLQSVSFEGLFGGQEFGLLGYEFKSLSSTVSLNQKSISIKDLKITDLSGEVLIPEIQIDQKENSHLFNVPKITLKDFKPSLLHRKGGGTQKHKPLIIESLELAHLKGDFNDPKTIEGSGSLKFLKSPKKQASLLNIPIHLLTKLGLDLTMLNPVEGRVLYEIKDKKIQFTRFIDVYSHDRHCHFNLIRSPGGSYLDFDGNLNLRIKMKQYVLLKITEPFIISVQGNYMNPKFSFRRKKIKVDVPEKISK